MSIVNGNQGSAADFPSTSSGAADSGKVPKLDSNGKLPLGFNYLHFGGTGADGALNVTSGTTTISAASAAQLVKNYTSINVSSGATLAFSTPAATGTAIFLKSLGNVTIAGTVTVAGMGGQGGAGSTGGSPTTNVGNNGIIPSFIKTLAGTVPSGASGGTAGAQTTTLTFSQALSTTIQEFLKYAFLWCGPGGSTGSYATSGSTITLGSGGNGGGCLVIECGGAYNFTGTISAAGTVGGNTTGTGGSGYCTSGAGGGTGGLIMYWYNVLTANSGTYTVSGGLGGSGAAAGTAQQGQNGGSSGGNLVNTGNSVGSVGNGVPASGAAGAAGLAFGGLNTNFT